MTLTNYWWLLIWVALGGGLLSIAIPRQQMNVLGKIEYRWSTLAVTILILPLILWCSLRTNSMIGDTAAYRSSFFAMPTSISEWPAYLEGVSKDKGFSIFSLFIKSLIGNSDVIYFFIIAAIQMGIVAWLYRKYSCNFLYSLFVFVASTDYISWMNNGIRQFLAVVIILSATSLFLKKKYVPAVIIICIAATMHASALLMIPIVFIVQGKAWNKKTVLLILASIAVLFAVDQFTDILDIALADTQYSSMVSDWTEWQDDGTNPLRVLVYSLPAIISLVGLKYIREADDPMINFAANASVVTAGLYLISMVTSGIFMGRLPIYTSLYSMGILLPWEIENIFTKDSAKIVYIVSVIGFAFFFYYQMHGWGML